MMERVGKGYVVEEVLAEVRQGSLEEQLENIRSKVAEEGRPLSIVASFPDRAVVVDEDSNFQMLRFAGRHRHIVDLDIPVVRAQNSGAYLEDVASVVVEGVMKGSDSIDSDISILMHLLGAGSKSALLVLEVRRFLEKSSPWKVLFEAKQDTLRKICGDAGNGGVQIRSEGAVKQLDTQKLLYKMREGLDGIAYVMEQSRAMLVDVSAQEKSFKVFFESFTQDVICLSQLLTEVFAVAKPKDNRRLYEILSESFNSYELVSNFIQVVVGHTESQ